MNITRRSVLAGSAGLLGLGAVVGPRKAYAGGGNLRVLAWQGYADQDWVDQFQSESGSSVDVVIIGTDDELWAKMQGSKGEDFDVIAVNTAQLQRYIDAGLVQPVDLSKIPNQETALPRFRDLSQISGATRDGQPYGVPLAYDAIGMIYNPEKVDAGTNSWSAMWDPALQGRVLAYDNGEHNFSVAALLLGFENPFKLSSEQMQTAKEKLVELKRNVLTFYSTPDEALQIVQTNDVAVMFANYGQQQVRPMKDASLNVGYVNPVEGALAWLDTWALSSGAKDKDLAHAWINFTLSKEVSGARSERTGFGSAILPSSAIGENDKIVWLESVENPTLRSDLWNEVKASL